MEMTIKRKHPKALPILFLTEMWERFGFYIVEGLLVLYMTQALGFSDSQSYAVLGGFTALVYIMPVFGGYIADKVFGFRVTIILGGLMLCAGYALLALSRFLYQYVVDFPVFKNDSHVFLYLSLGVVVIGNGFFKPNISSLLGKLYSKGDQLREVGFTIFYVGINLGVMLSTLLVGFVKNRWGWSVGFALASVGLLLGVIIFSSGLKLLKDAGKKPENLTNIAWFTVLLQNKIIFTFTLIVLVAIASFLLFQSQLAEIILYIVGVLLLLGLLFTAFLQERVVRNKFLALIILTLSSVVFWAIFFQLFFSLNLFISRDVNRDVFGFTIPTIAFISLESFFIIIIGPMMAALWRYLNLKNKNLSMPFKFALANLVIALAFLVLIIGASTVSDNTSLVNPLWIVAAYFLVTVAELLLSPLGLYAVTILSPPRLIGMMMGVWFVALGFGGDLAGVIAKFSSIPKNIPSRLQEVMLYRHAFSEYAYMALAVGVVMLILVPFVRGLIRSDQQQKS